MKLILGITATVLLPALLPFGWVTAAGANPTSIAQPGASALDTQEASVTESSEQEFDRLNNLANQINQGVGRQPARSGQSQAMPSLNEFLNLPENMVVRGTQRGGLAIGREF
jgi:hypothetical protein